MHATQLVVTAGQLALRSGTLLEAGEPICEGALSEYWIASRCRFDRWGIELRRLGHSQSAPPPDAAGDLLVSLAEEITLSEMLTRVVAAVCRVNDHRVATAESGSIGANTLNAHREATSRLAALTFAWWSEDSPRACHTRSLRRNAHQWTDALLAYVGAPGEVEGLAHNASRVREYAYDSAAHGAESSRAASQLLLHALRAAFAAASQPALNPDLNRRVAGAAWSLFGDAGYDSLGLMQPSWALRAQRTLDETTTMLERLFAEDTTPGASRLPTRWRI